MLSTAACAVAQDPATMVIDQLLAQAREHGSVQVIVTLRVPAGASSDAIEAVKRAALADMAGHPHRVVRNLGRLPQLVVDASEGALRALAASPHVERIDPSVPSPPLR
jgi:hypothetical protein